MSAFRQWLQRQSEKAEAALVAAEDEHGLTEAQGLPGWAVALDEVLKRYDAAHPSSPAHDPLTCPCCTEHASRIMELEEEREVLADLFGDIRAAGRELATLVEDLGIDGRAAGRVDEAIERWAKANGRWSMAVAAKPTGQGEAT